MDTDVALVCRQRATHVVDPTAALAHGKPRTTTLAAVAARGGSLRRRRRRATPPAETGEVITYRFRKAYRFRTLHFPLPIPR